MKNANSTSFFTSLFRFFTLIPLAALLLGSSSQPAATAGSTVYLPTISNGLPPAQDVVLIAAGDIAKCNFPGATETATLVNSIPGTVLALGDNAYDNGSAADYASCYDPTWGTFKDRTKPIPGNHDYLTGGASGYFNYFGTSAGDPNQGYYSYDLGDWHILAINSNCNRSGWVRDLYASRYVGEG